jgi:hypothetical protein
MMPSTVLLGALLLITTSTPVAPAPATPDAPSPDLCNASRRTFEEMRGQSPPKDPTPAPLPTRGPIPLPSPASPEVIGGITTKVREFVACLNAGDLLRAYGLYTDACLYSFLIREKAITRAAYDDLATPKPAPPEERIKILEIRRVRELPDGSVGAVVFLEYPHFPRPRTLSFTFVDEKGRWLINSVAGKVLLPQS